jgi:hypothetical protein
MTATGSDLLEYFGANRTKTGQNFFVLGGS